MKVDARFCDFPATFRILGSRTRMRYTSARTESDKEQAAPVEVAKYS